jgi:S-DNA-T family DNA segregation ATPase FtsK/SpoIIIE
MASRVSKFTSKSNMANWRQMMRASLIRSGALLGAAALGLFALFYGLAVLSYSAADAAFNSAAADVQHNWMGQGGAYVSDAMLFVFGVPAIFLFPLLLVFARRLWRDVPQPQWRRQLVLCLIGMLLIGFGMAYWQHNSDIGLPAGWGGTIALLLDNGTSALVGQIKGVFGTLLRVLIILGTLAGGAALVIRSLQLDRPLLRIPTLAMPKFGSVMGDAHALMGDDLAPPQIVEPKPPRKSVEPDQRKPPVIEDRTLAPKKAAFATGARQGDFFGSFVLPSLELLDPPPAISVPKLDKAALEANARLLESVLDDFHVKGQIVAVRPGPVVTMYELEPAAGIKSSRVIQLAEDIARNMSALPEHPNHFVAWLRTRNEFSDMPDTELRETFMPRRIYGDYVRSLTLHYTQPIDRRSPVETTFVDEQAVDIVARGAGARQGGA